MKKLYVVEFTYHWFQQHSVLLYSATLAVDARSATRFTKGNTPQTEFERGRGAADSVENF
jgi:hypothetical protein